jgi:hypothetical protein
MYRYRRADGQLEIRSGGDVVHLTPEDEADLADRFGPDWIGLFDCGPLQELQACGEETRHRHDNPRTSKPKHDSRGDRHVRACMPRRESAATCVPGAKVLLEINDERGAMWVRATCLATPSHTMLCDGRIMPASTPACLVHEPAKIPADGRIEIADAACWKRAKDGTVTLLGRGIVSAPQPLGSFVGLADPLLVEQSTRWIAASLA